MYVSSASPDLNLTSSGLDTGGEQLRLVCGEYIDQYGFIPYWRIATTVAGNLKCKHVVHAVVGDCRQSLEGSKQVHYSYTLHTVHAHKYQILHKQKLYAQDLAVQIKDHRSKYTNKF